MSVVYWVDSMVNNLVDLWVDNLAVYSVVQSVQHWVKM